MGFTFIDPMSSINGTLVVLSLMRWDIWDQWDGINGSNGVY